MRLMAAGLCHTDLLPGELPPEFFPGPTVYGHEAAGVVKAVPGRHSRRRLVRRPHTGAGQHLHAGPLGSLHAGLPSRAQSASGPPAETEDPTFVE